MERKKWKTLDPKTCRGPLMEECEWCTVAHDCLTNYFTKQNLPEATFGRIHSFVTAFYLPKLARANKGKAWMFYCYLNNIAGRSDKARAEGRYGVAFASLERIEREAGLPRQQVKHYTRVLEGREPGLEDVRLITRVKINYRGTYAHAVRWRLEPYFHEERLARLVLQLRTEEPEPLEVFMGKSTKT